MLRYDHAQAIAEILARERNLCDASHTTRTAEVVVGYTGTRKGMTGAQRSTLRSVLAGATEVHHGDCTGGDAELHELAYAMLIPIHIHPPIDPKLRAFCTGYSSIADEKTYQQRNRDIVRAADLVVATPKEDTEPLPARGQGTWSVIRYAQRTGRRVTIIWPSGGTSSS